MPETPDPIELAALRADKHWYEDGLPSLLRGLLLALLVLFATGDRAGFHSILLGILSLIGYFTCLALLIGNNRKILEWIKVRVTYPRTGYTPPPPDPRPANTGFFWPPIPSAREIEIINRRETMTVLARAIFFLTWALSIGRVEWRWQIFLISIMYAAILWFERPRQNATWAAPLFSVCAGLATALTGIKQKGQFWLFVSLVSGFFVLDGLFKLFRFLRRNPRVRVSLPPLDTGTAPAERPDF